MSTWFEVKVKYQKVQPNGSEKSVVETYLLNAVSFTDSEEQIYTEMEKYITGDFSVTNIKIANYSELHHNDNGYRWFKCKVSFISIDESKGYEKKSNTYMLVQANNVNEAYDNLEKALSDMASDYEIPAIQESTIMDVFEYNAEKTIRNC
jgi:hypothetical protein